MRDKDNFAWYICIPLDETSKPLEPVVPSSNEKPEVKQINSPGFSSTEESTISVESHKNVRTEEKQRIIQFTPTSVIVKNQYKSAPCSQALKTLDEVLEEVLENEHFLSGTRSISQNEISTKIELNREPVLVFTYDEGLQLQQLLVEHNDIYVSVNFGEALIKDMLMSSMSGLPISTSSAINGYHLQRERMTRIANSLEGFTGLRKSDQTNLLKENVDLLVNLRGAIFFDKKKGGLDQILCSMGKGRFFIYIKIFLFV